jgi:hypothetical protein
MLVVLVLYSPLVGGGIPCLGGKRGSLTYSPLSSPPSINISTKAIELLDES